MESTRTEITFSGVNPPNPTSKVIERQIQKWIERQQSLHFPRELASYTAHIDREGYRFYTCHIEIRIGSREWTGLEGGRSIHGAVLNTLNHMKPKERIDLRRPSSLLSPTQASA